MRRRLDIVFEGEEVTLDRVIDEYRTPLMFEVYRVIEDYLGGKRASMAVFSKQTLKEMLPLYANSSLAFFVKRLTGEEADSLLHLLILMLAVTFPDMGIPIRDSRGRLWWFDTLQPNARLVFSRV